MSCSIPGCQMNSSGRCPVCGLGMGYQPLAITPTPSPRFMPVNIPFSLFGITVVTLDGHGNVEIRVDQPYPQSPQETASE